MSADFCIFAHDLPAKNADFRRKLDKIRNLAQKPNNYRLKSAVLSDLKKDIPPTFGRKAA